MKISAAFLIAAAVLSLVTIGCSSPDRAAKPEKGPKGTVAYTVEVEASEVGVRIEADNDFVGKTPCTLKIFGDKDGSFHNFGNPEYVVTAHPTKQGQSVQTKVFRTGWWFGKEDRIPKRLYFDMDAKPQTASGGFTVDLPSKQPETSETK